MKLGKIKSVPSFIKNLLKPEWKRLAIVVLLFLVLPQNISGEFTFFGGVYLIKYLFETYQPALDITTFVLVLVTSYILVSIIVWFYDNKINKFIMVEGEETVEPEEEAPKDKQDGPEKEEQEPEEKEK